ncbi:MAG: hypothetical protein KKB03_00380 [Nanoarchaeota archaeon]|nr:hypothetical protein [Nanoarchaeota archaeon]
MRWCTYSCEASDNDKAQTKACRTDSQVYCDILDKGFTKGYPCSVGDEDFDKYIKNLRKDEK